MEFIRSLFTSRKSPIVETDEVYPLTLIDHLAPARGSVLSETLRFDQVLDADKLHDALTKLIQQHGDWRKLGGRLRLRLNGSLEIHVPREFTEERPAVHFTKQAFDITIEEHELGIQLPKLADGPSLQPGPTVFDQFNPIPDRPQTWKDYAYSDRPILRLHVTSFTNSTLVTLIWSHVVFGGCGIKELITAWSKVLRGDDDVPALLGARTDILEGIGTAKDASVPFCLEPSKITGWSFVRIVLGLLWALWMHPKVETRALCLPRRFVSQLRKTCLKDLENADGEGKGAFLSEGDVLEAWLARFVGEARGDEKSALIMNALDIQSRLNAPWGAGGVYVQNTGVCTWTSITPDILLRGPLGELAYVIRRSIQELATDEQIRAQLRIFRSLGHTKMLPLFGDPNSHVMNFSNWSKFNLFDAADLSPAVVPNSPSLVGGHVGKPVYMHCQAVGENRMLRNCFNITGKDWDDNYWITAFLYPEDWEKLEEYMELTQLHISEKTT